MNDEGIPGEREELLRDLTSGDDGQRYGRGPTLAEQEMGGDYLITTEATELGHDDDVDGYEVAARPTAGGPATGRERLRDEVRDEVRRGAHADGREVETHHRVHWEEHTGRGRFVLLDREGEAHGELHYRRQGSGLVLADHTWVSPELRGRGAGRRLFASLVRWARKHDEKVATTCSFVEAMFAKDESARDVAAP